MHLLPQFEIMLEEFALIQCMGSSSICPTSSYCHGYFLGNKAQFLTLMHLKKTPRSSISTTTWDFEYFQTYLKFIQIMGVLDGTTHLEILETLVVLACLGGVWYTHCHPNSITWVWNWWLKSMLSPHISTFLSKISSESSAIIK